MDLTPTMLASCGGNANPARLSYTPSTIVLRIAKAAPRGPKMPPRRLHDAPTTPPRGPKLPPSGTRDAPRGLSEDVNMAPAMTPEPL
eukprot:2638043-Pyramimonas_sp.AAC.1